MMKNAVWEISDDGVGLRTEEGDVIHLTASQVYDTVFGKEKNPLGFFVNDELAKFSSHLIFSRFPALPALRLYGSPNIKVELGVSAGGQFKSARKFSDQIIIDNQWFPIRKADLVSAYNWAELHGLTSDQTLNLNKLIRLRAMKDLPVTLFDEIDSRSSSFAKRDSKGSLTGLKAVLYPYQKEGISFMQFIAEQELGCILADEMGLGKTLQVIGLLQSELNLGMSVSLIITPATLIENWKREFAQFSPQMRVKIHNGLDRSGIAKNLTNCDIVITSYDTAVRDEELLSEIKWNVIALDEAQAIKNPSAQRTLASKRLSRRVSIAISGTPVENSLLDLWSIVDFVLPDFLGSIDDFKSNVANDLEGAANLSTIAAPVILRRRVVEVAEDLPEKIEIRQAIACDIDFARSYDALRLQTIADCGPSGGLVALTKLRQYCAHPILVGISNPDPTCGSPKYTRFIEILEEIFAAGEKVIIFTSYHRMIDTMGVDLPRRFLRIYCDYIDGRRDVAERQPIVDAFFAHTGPGALLLNPKAAGTGLNITAANHVIHYNPEWNPALTAQATARAYRRKQVKPVTIHHLFLADTVEQVIIERATFKLALAQNAVTGHDGGNDISDTILALQSTPLKPSTKE